MAKTYLFLFTPLCEPDRAHMGMLECHAKTSTIASLDQLDEIRQLQNR